MGIENVNKNSSVLKKLDWERQRKEEKKLETQGACVVKGKLKES